MRIAAIGAPGAAAIGLVSLLVLLAFGAAPSAADRESAPAAIDAAADPIADVVVGVPEGPTAADDASAIVATLRRSPAIVWAADDLLQPAAPNLLVAFDPDTPNAGRRAVEAAIAARLERNGVAADGVPAAEMVAASDYTISGRAVTDDELLDRIGLGAALAVVVAALTMGGLVAWRVGPIQGALSGVTLAVSAWLSGEIGESVAGAFDGSLATTALPAVFGGIVVSSYALIRLLVWFDNPIGDDQADTIRRAVSSVGVELLLVLTGFGVVALFLELVSSTRSVATVFAVGVLASALLTLAVVPPVLAVVGPTDDPWWEPIPIPSGHDVPIFVLAGFALFLTGLGLFAFRSTSDGELLDERALVGDSEAVAGTRELLAAGGDPTVAIFADFPEEVGQVERTAWLERVSALEGVERVDTPTSRYVGGTAVPLDEVDVVAGPPEGAEAADAPGYAFVVPGVGGRSAGAVELVAAIDAANAPVDAALSGVPVDASAAADADRSQVWATILALALVGGAAVFALIGDLGLAALAAAVRVVGLAGVAGVYHLLVGEVSGTEIQLALLVVCLGAGLFELGFLRWLLGGRHAANTDRLLDEALEVEGTAGTVAMAMGAIASLALLVPDLIVVRRFGILLAVVILIETVVGIWFLRPVMLGGRTISHFAARPVRLALDSLAGSRVSSQAEHRAWVDVIKGLLETEFSFQADPAAADISSVFVAETPLFRKSLDHHLNLADAGLRIVGRQPQLRALRVVSNAAPATLVVTVDHPIRQLLDDAGKIVGVRQAERRSVMLWMVMQSDGSYRIADSVELGATSLASGEEPVPVPSVVAAAAE